MVRRSLAVILLLAGIAGPVMAATPNILLIVAEDLSPRIGVYGDEIANTPNIDALAGEGIRYTNVYAAAGVCAPNRSALISGMFPISLGTHQMRTTSLPLPSGEVGYDAVPPAAIKAFPELLRQQGYATINFAKKDYQFGEPGTIWDKDVGNYMSPLIPDLWSQLPAGKPFFAMVNLMSTHEGHLISEDAVPTGKFAAFMKAVQQLQKQTVKPVTNPADVTVPPYYPDTAKVRRSLAQHYDNIHYMDSQVGQILSALKEDGLEQNTIVIWTTDHGDALPRAKRSVYDSGLHIPMIIRFPDGKKAGTVDDQLVSMVDFAPTILAFANAPKPDFLQGRDIFSQTAKRQYVYGSRDRMDLIPDKVRAVRDERYKYIRNDMAEIPYFRPLAFRDMFPVMQSWWDEKTANGLNTVQNFYFTSPRPAEELYDTENDPWEVKNIAHDQHYKDKLAELRQALKDWEERVKDRSGIDELTMVQDMWPEFKQPTTGAPSFSVIDCETGKCLAMTSATENASISYQTASDNGQWKLYTRPVPVGTDTHIQAKAVRYGFKDSIVEHYNYE